MVTPAVRRQAVALVEHVFAVSRRRACEALAVSRRRVEYRSKKNDEALREHMKALAGQCRRFGYRRLAVMLKRDECLNENVFTSLAYARYVIEAWRQDYNNVRLHSSLGYQTPASRRARLLRSRSLPLAQRPQHDYFNPKTPLHPGDMMGSRSERHHGFILSGSTAVLAVLQLRKLKV
ncbi:MAG: transposase [Proteobacteria bacterium]|nr:transposase [Pseudomonadota bacterium]